MKRRQLLRALAGAGAAGLTGCTEIGPGSGPANTPTPEPPDLTRQSFEVREKACETGTGRATIAGAASTVTVTGVIKGSNACYTAGLQRARYDADADELRVDVRSFDPEEEDVCAECIVAIDYRAAFEFEGSLPATVTVRHNGERVATAMPEPS